MKCSITADAANVNGIFRAARKFFKYFLVKIGIFLRLITIFIKTGTIFRKSIVYYAQNQSLRIEKADENHDEIVTNLKIVLTKHRRIGIILL